MSALAPPEHITKTEEWVVVWFPPEGDHRKTFTGTDAEDKARQFARTDDVSEWNPLLDHRIVTTMVVSELVPL